MFKKFQLKNGLEVLLVESHKSPVVSIQMWVHTGSADEKKGEEGLSHFIEHLVFKGTKKFNVGEIASTVEGSGGELNAYTSFDQTVFYVTISKEFLGTGLEVISEMMGFPQFDGKEIDNEREVVIEEIKRGQDNLHRQASRLLFSTLYKDHPYGIPVIGYEKVIRQVSRKKILNYYHARYVPKNMTLMVVGDFDRKEIKKDIEKYFESFEPYKLEKRTRKKELVQNKPRIKVLNSAFEESVLYLAWRAPSVKHKDIPAMDVFSLILGQGESSRLSQSLHLKSGLVNSIGASAFTPKDPGFFAISMTFNHKNLSTILKILEEELRQILESLPSIGEMEKALVNFNSEELYSLETVDGMARKYGTYEHLFGDYKYFKTFLANVNQLTPKDILAVARKYLNPKTLNITLLTPGEAAPLQNELKAFLKSFEKTYAAAKATKIPSKVIKVKRVKFGAGPKNSEFKGENPFFHFKTKGGTPVFIRPSHETSVVSIRTAGLGGLRVESEDEGGLTELLSRSWMAGTQSHTEQELTELIEAKASSLGAFGGRNTAGVSLTTLKPFESFMVDLFFEALCSPVFNPASVEREKRLMVEQIRSRKDSPAQQAILAFMSSLFGTHPYSRDPLGTEESLEKLTSSNLRSLWSKVSTQKNMMLVVSGSVDPDEVFKRIEAGIGHLDTGVRLNNQFAFQPPQAPQRLFQESKKEQSHLVVGFPGLTFKDPRRYALQVLQSILAGQGGRLFIELRDKASLAYSVAPLRMEGIDAGYFGAYIGCSPDKGATALRMMREQFDRLVDERVSEDELQRSKRYLIGRHDIELQRTSSAAASILFDAIYDLPADESFHFADKINGVTSENVRDLAKHLFSQPEVISLVGPQPAW